VNIYWRKTKFFSKPKASRNLLDVLNLFSELFNLNFEVKTNGGQSGIIGFCAKRIALATQFLRKKIKTPTDRAACC